MIMHQKKDVFHGSVWGISIFVIYSNVEDI